MNEEILLILPYWKIATSVQGSPEIYRVGYGIALPPELSGSLLGAPPSWQQIARRLGKGQGRPAPGIGWGRLRMSGKPAGPSPSAIDRLIDGAR